jgi:acyl carrier protein
MVAHRRPPARKAAVRLPRLRLPRNPSSAWRDAAAHGWYLTMWAGRSGGLSKARYASLLRQARQRLGRLGGAVIVGAKLAVHALESGGWAPARKLLGRRLADAWAKRWARENMPRKSRPRARRPAKAPAPDRRAAAKHLVDTAVARARKTAAPAAAPASRDGLRNAVVLLVAKAAKTAPGKIKGSDRLRDDLGIDSLDGASLLLGIESKLGITIPEEKAFDAGTVDELVAFVRKLVRR